MVAPVLVGSRQRKERNTLNNTSFHNLSDSFLRRKTLKSFHFIACQQIQICPGLNANKIQIPYDKHHKVSLLVKSHQTTHNSAKYQVV